MPSTISVSGSVTMLNYTVRQSSGSSLSYIFRLTHEVHCLRDEGNSADLFSHHMVKGGR